MRLPPLALFGLGSSMGLAVSLIAVQILYPIHAVDAENVSGRTSLNPGIALPLTEGSPPATGNTPGSIDLPNKLPNAPGIRLAKPTKPPTAVRVEAIARQVTVRVITDPIAGSGVLLGRRGNAYLVLTCDHVVAESKGTYRILTSDGKTHVASRVILPALQGLDLALLKFRADTDYPIITLGDSAALAQGVMVYSSGFPNYRYYPSENLLASTASWGLRAYQFIDGRYSMSLNRPLPGGYQLGYTNDVEQGMSGGPVLDEGGRLVGINGRLKYPIQGINAYTFADGTRPSTAQFEQMEALSWAVPVASFRWAIDQLLVQAQF